MSDTCGVITTEFSLLAVTREMQVADDDVPSRITGMFDVVYGWLPQSGVTQTGHNYAIYRHTRDGMQMRVGFPVSDRFDATDAVECVEFGGRNAAHITHRGDYGGIPGAYSTLHAWCKAHGHELAGLNWEVYGDWQDDPTKLTTDIYLALA